MLLIKFNSDFSHILLKGFSHKLQKRGFQHNLNIAKTEKSEDHSYSCVVHFKNWCDFSVKVKCVKINDRKLVELQHSRLAL